MQKNCFKNYEKEDKRYHFRLRINHICLKRSFKLLKINVSFQLFVDTFKN